MMGVVKMEIDLSDLNLVSCDECGCCFKPTNNNIYKGEREQKWLLAYIYICPLCKNRVVDFGD